MNTNTSTGKNSQNINGQSAGSASRGGAGKAVGAVMIFFGILFLILLSRPEAKMAGAVLQSSYSLANLIALGLLIGGIVLICRGRKSPGNH